MFIWEKLEPSHLSASIERVVLIASKICSDDTYSIATKKTQRDPHRETIGEIYETTIDKFEDDLEEEEYHKIRILSDH